MIEYKDEKLGHIKVLNVTEARANFAAVLGDANSQYIITKNNKPLRVIIDYGEYEALKQSVKTGVPATKTVKPTEESDTELKKRKKSKSRVKGMLESTMALSQKEGEEPEETKQAMAVNASAEYTPPKDQQKPIQKEKPLPQPKQEEPISKKSFETNDSPVKHRPQRPEDPTQVIKPEDIEASAASQFTLQESLAVPEGLQEKGNVILEEPVEQKALAQEMATDQFLESDELESEEEEDYFKMGELEDDSLLIAPDDADMTTTKSASSERGRQAGPKEPVQETSQIAEEYRSPEEEEYFQKFKKLYQRDEAEQDEDIDTNQTELSTSYDDLQLETEHVSLSESLIDEIPEAPQEQDIKISDVVPDLDINKAPPKPEPKNVKAQVDAGDDLPSLKDLLKDLENEKLSDEEPSEKNMDENEIDDLIERITQD